MDRKAKIYIAGDGGVIFWALKRALQDKGYSNFVTRDHGQLNLLNERAVADFFTEEKPEYVFIVVSKSGSILANINYPADFIYDNLVVQSNIIHNAYLNRVKKLLFFGASCVYPKAAPQPIKEEYFLTGELEPTSQSYAVAKIAGVEICRAYNKQYGTKFISVIPATLYGPGDHFDAENSHVLSALIRKFHEAKINNEKEVILWGTGTPRREFLFADDLAEACILIMKTKTNFDLINVGAGYDLTIAELAGKIKAIADFEGNIQWDTTKPDGVKQKLLDNSRLKSLGWQPKISIDEGLTMTYEWFVNNYDNLAK